MLAFVTCSQLSCSVTGTTVSTSRLKDSKKDITKCASMRSSGRMSCERALSRRGPAVLQEEVVTKPTSGRAYVCENRRRSLRPSCASGVGCLATMACLPSPPSDSPPSGPGRRAARPYAPSPPITRRVRPQSWPANVLRRVCLTSYRSFSIMFPSYT